MSASIRHTRYADSPDLALAPLQHQALEQALAAACAQLEIQQAYLAALRDPARGRQPSLLLAVAGADEQALRRLAILASELLPDRLELDLIELADDSLSDALREHCEAFYRR
ncbi:enhanced serine sensitivity protein SseB C-terminal domain-containing protein [Pseudomonas sp. NCCP-436]|uniref:enhanced serine sensitivity protein SseB C-terminal domain-containing protein n=1 Tax=Pseudomonas sp. NCCP-436 TaxID=2842481 RepID=UPI001C80F070|nr:enhanced serine sensitivity protein SseB C-terminal domain-containing protein [Pseudomonas sp. NCCP-436]GIZ10883.1 hypothetical protein NCCP436_02990 [Pseudomonas sp. NCCP-436]